MDYTIKRNNGFFGEKLINVPTAVIDEHIRNNPFRNALYLNNMGYFPNAQFHYHIRERGCSDYILIYCLDGKGHCETQNGSFVIRSNQFILLPPNQFHCYQADPTNPWTIYCVHFSGSMMDDLKADFDLEKYETPTTIPFNEQILGTWQGMYSSLSEGYTFESIAYTNLNLYHFISLFLFPNKGKKIEVEPKKEDQLDMIISYMKANINKRLTADEIAKEFNYSASHFSVLFKQKTGLSPIDYFIRVKIRHACELLTKSDLIIKEVAQAVGYDDPFYFSRSFKKVTGRSPVDYKGKNSMKHVDACSV